MYSLKIGDQLHKLIDKLLLSSRLLNQLKNDSRNHVIRALLDCKSRRFLVFAHDLKLTIHPPDQFKVSGKLIPEQKQKLSIRNFLSQPGEFIAISQLLERKLLTVYRSILSANETSHRLRISLESQMCTIIRCNESVSKLLPEIVLLDESLPPLCN